MELSRLRVSFRWKRPIVVLDYFFFFSFFSSFSYRLSHPLFLFSPFQFDAFSIPSSRCFPHFLVNLIFWHIFLRPSTLFYVTRLTFNGGRFCSREKSSLIRISTKPVGERGDSSVLFFFLRFTPGRRSGNEEKIKKENKEISSIYARTPLGEGESFMVEKLFTSLEFLRFDPREKKRAR